MTLELISKQSAGGAHATPVLFVHGAWHGAWCWDQGFLDYFASRGFSAHALSLRNHGASDAIGGLWWKSIANYVVDVATVAARLSRPPIIVGHSMGGFVTQHYLVSHAAPAAVLLASVPPSGVFRTTLKLAARHPIAFLKSNVTWSLYPFVATAELAREAFFSADMSDAQVDAYQRRLQDESYRAYLDMLAFDLPQPSPLRTPLLVLGAERDAIFSPAEVEATARAYGVTAEIVPGMAHDMMLEKDWEKVAARIADWLEATSGLA